MASVTMAPEMVDVAGTPVAMRRKGEGDPLVFLHGMGFTTRWLPFHEALAQQTDVIAPEHIGFGDTPMQGWLREIADMAIHYDDFANALDLDTFHLVGYSLGGWISAKYASLFPRRVRSLTLLVPAGIRLPGSPTNLDPFALDPLQLARALFLDPDDPRNIGEVMDLPEGVDPIDAMTRVYDQLATGARLAWNPRHDRKLPRQLRRVDCPVLLVGAEEDKMIPRENSVDAYAGLLPQARQVNIPKTGHALVIEQPDAVAAAILDFLEDIA